MNRIYLVALALIGCGATDNSGTEPEPADSGISEATTGGQTSLAPKSLTTGGAATSTGGQAPTGGSSTIARATGGSAPVATGGQSATGGTQATGGESATGGSSPAPMTAFACQDGTVRPSGQLKCMCRTTAPLCDSGLYCESGICRALATQ